MKFYLKLSACVVFAAAYGLFLWFRPIFWFTFVLGVPICFWIASWFHELGHFLAYRLWKLEWKRMAVGWFVFERGKGMRLDRQRKIWEACCTCAYDPDKSIGHYTVALLSGGLLVLAMGVGAIIAGHFCGGSARSFLICFGGVCGMDAGWNLLPVSADRILLRKIKEERENTA